MYISESLCRHITQLLCCTAVLNTTFEINYTSIFKKEIKNIKWSCRVPPNFLSRSPLTWSPFPSLIESGL